VDEICGNRRFAGGARPPDAFSTGCTINGAAERAACRAGSLAGRGTRSQPSGETPGSRPEKLPAAGWEPALH